MFGRVLFLTLLAGGGTLLWMGADGQAERLRALTEQLPGIAPPADVEQPPMAEIRTDTSPVSQAPVVHTWTDARGVTHFAQAGTTPPANATRHQTGSSGTLADYEKAVEQQTGLSSAAVARARENLQRAPTAAENAKKIPAGGGTTTAEVQAYELMANHERALQQIRDTNNH